MRLWIWCRIESLFLTISPFYCLFGTCTYWTTSVFGTTYILLWSYISYTVHITSYIYSHIFINIVHVVPCSISFVQVYVLRIIFSCFPVDKRKGYQTCLHIWHFIFLIIFSLSWRLLTVVSWYADTLRSQILCIRSYRIFDIVLATLYT